MRIAIAGQEFERRDAVVGPEYRIPRSPEQLGQRIEPGIDRNPGLTIVERCLTSRRNGSAGP